LAVIVHLLLYATNNVFGRPSV